MFKVLRYNSRCSQACKTVHTRSFHRVRYIMAETSKDKNDSVHEQRQDPILAEEIEGTLQPEASNKAFVSKRTNACMSNLPSFLNFNLTVQSQN